MLAAADEKWAVDFYAVDIDGVLIERTSAHIVLGGELIVGGDSCLAGDESFYSSSAGIAHVAKVAHVDIGHGGGLASYLVDGDVAEHVAYGGKYDVEGDGVGGIVEDSLACLVAEHGEDDDHGVGTLAAEAVFSFQIAYGSCCCTFYTHLCQFYWRLFVVNDFAFDDDCLCCG